MPNIVIGILLVAAGASGRFVLIGTQSNTALVGAGIALVGWGAFQVWRRKAAERDGIE